MISLLLAACLAPPLFDMSGPACSPSRQTVECACSECMAWDAVPGATRYEVTRETISTGAVYGVGAVYSRFVDDIGTLGLPTLWCAAWDVGFPRAGTLYRYQVRGCNAAACGGWSSAVQYRGAPYACFTGGREVQCYVGDSVATR
jgi:hypothetical protein